MRAENVKFSVTPQIVEADIESTIKIRALDGNFLFYDDLTYKIHAYPMEESDVSIDYALTSIGYENERKVFEVRPVNGEISFTYKFIGEQEWKIHIFCDEYDDDHQNPMYRKNEKTWMSLINEPKSGVKLSVYALKPDLYSRRALRGDFHIHSNISDGDESPALVAAYYRMAGYDVCALTDHYYYNSGKFANEKFDFKTDFQIMCAEEVHNNYYGHFHMVNLGGKKSVNTVYFDEPERIEREVSALKGTVTVPDGLNEREYLHRVWLYREAKKNGGFVVFPHPHWEIYNHYHTETKMSRAIMENGLCDAFEIFGGVHPDGMHLQAALYHSMQAEGLKLPIIGSTDCHSVFKKDFKMASTILFSKEDDVVDAIASFYSVAVLSYPNESPKIVGDYRLVKYAYFLLNNYFPTHDELCAASGNVMVEYVLGNTEVKSLAETMDARVSAFEKKFFGR